MVVHLNFHCLNDLYVIELRHKIYVYRNTEYLNNVTWRKSSINL